MSDKSHRVDWICRECGTEFSAPNLDRYSWSQWSAPVCPNGRHFNVIAKIETPEQARQAVRAWFDFHERNSESRDRNRKTPILIDIDSLTYGITLNIALIRLGMESNSRRGNMPDYLCPIRDAIREGIETLSPEGDLMTADLNGLKADDSTWFVGNRAGFHQWIDQYVIDLSNRVRVIKRDPASWNKSLEDELERMIEICEELDYRSAELRGMLHDAFQALEDHKAQQIARETELAQLADRRMKDDMIRGSMIALVGLPMLAFAIWAYDIGRALLENSDVFIMWLTGLEPTPESLTRGWNARPEQIAEAIQGGAIIISLLLCVAAFILFQVPLFYFLVALGLMLSFLAYKQVWMLVSGLVFLAVGMYVFHYNWQRQ